jgi:hypothetical protein
VCASDSPAPTEKEISSPASSRIRGVSGEFGDEFFDHEQRSEEQQLRDR